MPTENRSNNADGWIACDDGLHLIQMDKNLSHYGWVFRKVDGGLPCSVREATSHEMAHAQARQHLRIGVAQIAGQAPDPQAHPEPASYPPCDYCGTVPSYHPWHGSGMLNGLENRHIHACDGCRWQLPSHPGLPHPEPIAWMVGTAFWWTKEEAERDAAATGLPIIGLGPMTDASEIERLVAANTEYARRHLEQLGEIKRMDKATAFVQRLVDCSGTQPSVATGYLRDILDELKGNTTPTAPVERDERAEFEADWARRKKAEGCRDRANAFYRIQPNDRYRWGDVQDAWDAWQARAALERKP